MSRYLIFNNTLISILVGLKVDKASKTWSQLFGLPVITPMNKQTSIYRQNGQPYKVSDRIEPPKPK